MIVETVLKDGNIQVNALKKIPEICHTTDVAVTKRRYENIIPFLFFSFYFSLSVSINSFSIQITIKDFFAGNYVSSILHVCLEMFIFCFLGHFVLFFCL